jgi:hypothetical protein
MRLGFICSERIFALVLLGGALHLGRQAALGPGPPDHKRDAGPRSVWSIKWLTAYCGSARTVGILRDHRGGPREQKNRSGFGWFPARPAFRAVCVDRRSLPATAAEAEGESPAAERRGIDQPASSRARRGRALGRRPARRGSVAAHPAGMKKCPQCGAAQPNAQSICADCCYRFG